MGTLQQISALVVGMAKNWVTFNSNFSFVPRPPKNDPKIAEKQQNFKFRVIFRCRISYLDVFSLALVVNSRGRCFE